MYGLAQSIYDLLKKADDVVRTIIGILFPLATAIFLWGVIEYMRAAGDEKKIKDARQKITYGIIGLFLMVAVWGIVKAIVVTFGLDVFVETKTTF
ncbi:MAG: hypothetical protein AAB522_03295 [Patescibacteria group bacterium]